MWSPTATPTATTRPGMMARISSGPSCRSPAPAARGSLPQARALGILDVEGEPPSVDDDLDAARTAALEGPTEPTTAPALGGPPSGSRSIAGSSGHASSVHPEQRALNVATGRWRRGGPSVARSNRRRLCAKTGSPAGEPPPVSVRIERGAGRDPRGLVHGPSTCRTDRPSAARRSRSSRRPRGRPDRATRPCGMGSSSGSR